MVLRAAAMCQPAHQRGVAPGHLHAVDAEIVIVLALVARPFGHDQRPGDERRRLARPAGLDREIAEIDVAAAQHHLLARRARHRARLHRHHRAQQRQHVERLAPAAGRLGLFQESQRLADLAQARRLAVHAPGDALHRPEEIGQHRRGVARAVRPHHILEQHGRAALGEEAGVDLGDLAVGRHRHRDPLQRALPVEVRQKIAQRGVWHSICFDPICAKEPRATIEGTRKRSQLGVFKYYEGIPCRIIG